jgi:hypothetical protein
VPIATPKLKIKELEKKIKKKKTDMVPLGSKALNVLENMNILRLKN